SQDLVEVKLVFHCVDEKPACLAHAGRQLGVDWLLYGKLRPQAPDGATVLVELHQLHVGRGVIENTIKESVPARVLTQGDLALESLTQRWLLMLAAPARQARPRSARPALEVRWNRGLWISSAVLGSLAGVAALAALGTGRGVNEAQDQASGHLDVLAG